MRKHTPHSMVLWYDAVTTEGKLQWQDCLTDLNQPFFDACDGIFVNYTWQVRSTACRVAKSQILTDVICFGCRWACRHRLLKLAT